MARRTSRRRRPKVAWFPTFGGAQDPEFVAQPFAGIEVELTTGSEENGDIIWDAFPLTFDETESAIATQDDPTKVTLRDIVQGNEWRFRRLVGKAFISAATATVGSANTTLTDVALGFIVVKTYDDGAPVTDFNTTNPLSQDSMEDPWIWRRRWILNPHGTIVPASPTTADITNIAGWAGYPSTTAGYGSVMDGPHIDAKSNRVIHRSERLYGVLALRNYNPQIGTLAAVAFNTTRLLLDYRIVGSLKGSTYGNRGNMSR